MKKKALLIAIPFLVGVAFLAPKLGRAVTYGSNCDVSVSLCDNAVNSAKIEDATIVNADISTSAAIAYSKLSLTSSLLQSDMAASVLKFTDLNLTAVQQDTLNATPVTAIAAPGAGYITQVISATCFIDFVSVRNEAGSGVLSFKYTDGSGVKATADIPNATYELNSDTYYIAVGASGIPVVNAAIVATIDADVTSGDSLVNCRLYYRTVQVSDI